MKSTVRIDYDRSDELKPVIKIILPLNAGLCDLDDAGSDIDPRDKLVRDFLWTPRNQVENYLFEVNQKWRFKNGDIEAELTTIASIPEEYIFQRFETAILGRIVGIDNIRENPTPQQLKIADFFEWLKEQPYHKDQQDINATPPVVPILTYRHVFETSLNQEERMAAFKNTPKYKLDSEVKDAYTAIDTAFDWKTSPEGWDYWDKVSKCIK